MGGECATACEKGSASWDRHCGFVLEEGGGKFDLWGDLMFIYDVRCRDRDRGSSRGFYQDIKCGVRS